MNDFRAADAASIASFLIQIKNNQGAVVTDSGRAA